MSQVTGPYALTAGETLSVHDPTSNSASVVCQVQNVTGFILTITNPQGQWSIPPNWAQTIATDGGAPIRIQVSAGGSAGAGLSLLWLLRSDLGQGGAGNLPDGAIPVTNPTTSLNSTASSATTANVTQGASATLLAAPATGQINSLGTLSLATFLSQENQVTITDSATGGGFVVNTEMPAAGSSDPPLIFPVDYSTVGTLTANVVAGGTGSVTFTITYRALPLQS